MKLLVLFYLINFSGFTDENKLILTQVSCTIEIIYLCSDCYKNKYEEQITNQFENQKKH